MKKTILWTMTGALLMGTGASAGVLVDPAELPVAARQQLQSDISAARQASPARFTQVAAVAGKSAYLDGIKRGRMAPMSPVFRALGPDAALPMMEQLVFAPALAANTAPSARLALQLGLVEALGSLSDVRAAPIFRAVLAKPDADVLLVRSAARGLSRLGDDAEQAHVETLVGQASGERQLALLGGLAYAKNLRATRSLASALKAEQDGVRAKSLVRSLSMAAQPPSTSMRKASSDQPQKAQAAADALMAAYTRFGGDTRTAIETAVMVVDAPQTSTLIQQAATRSGTDAETRRDVERLGQRFNAPTRTRR